MQRFLLPLLLLAETAALAPMSGVRFGSWDAFSQTFGWYLNDLVVDAAPILVLSFGMTAVLMSGGIDLSVGSMTALVACVMATFEPGRQFWLTAIPVGLAVGAGLGLFNGLLVAAFDVPPIIATLGTLFFYRGLCDAVLKGTKPSPFIDVPGYGRLGELAGVLVLFGVVLVLGGAWFRWSRWRREILMIGGNRVAARYAAIPVNRRLVELYTLSGILAFIAAICFTAHDGSASAASYNGLELQVIVAVVLGGTSVNGGRGSVLGSVVGVFLVAVLAEGLRAGGSVFWIQEKLPFKFNNLRFVLLGTLLLIGVWINTRLGCSAEGSLD
ncbi:MAG TPA: ABC transporter permease [Planctomycetaceae bacterium]|nr:ABC transporter permease [Planctomycetaceae bacterium]